MHMVLHTFSTTSVEKVQGPRKGRLFVLSIILFYEGPGFGPKTLELFWSDFLKCQTLTGQLLSDLFNPHGKVVGSLAQSVFGIDVEMAGEVDYGEKDIPDGLFLGSLVRLLQSYFQSGEFCVDASRRSVIGEKIKSGAARFSLQFGGPHQGGEGLGDTVKKGTGCIAGRFFLVFDPVPLAVEGRKVPFRCVGKDMGVTPYEFVGYGVGHIADIEFPTLLEEPGEENDLQQQVSKFLPDGLRLSVVNSLQHLVGLFHEVLAEGFRCLFGVPGAPLRRAQGRHDANQAHEGLTNVAHCQFFLCWRLNRFPRIFYSRSQLNARPGRVEMQINRLQTCRK